MMRTLAAVFSGLILIGLTPPLLAQDTNPGLQQPQTLQQQGGQQGMPAGLLPGSYSQQSQSTRGSEEPTVPGGDHTAAVTPVGAETAAPIPGNGMVLGGSDASAALPEMQVPQRPGEGKGTLQ